ncbi:hypothetical protein R1T40_05515 [Tritonibacter scottomollicae]|uniref:Uncharacterized protein n=1 Tax=Tritonibacter scottomollicae TaxID=483013 RepID=A0ABZ0HJQ1_TRISK|nr:hypothetical protein [Tritonibacter scottomollicae]WOI34190.1 hypothetical protein R1T40_05515 [Tritonibacter scottomollicae]
MSTETTIGEGTTSVPASRPGIGTAEYLIAAIKAFSEIEQETVESLIVGQQKVSKEIKKEIKRAQADIRRWERQALQSLTETQNEVTEVMEEVALELDD